MYEEQDTVETYEEETSRPFSEIPRLWLQIFQMTEEFFRREAPRASGSNTVLSLLIAVAVPFVVSLILIMAMMPFTDVKMGAFEETWVIISVSILLPLAGLYLITGVIYVLARVFGGKGDFGTQVYLQSLYTVPIVVVMTVLVVIMPAIQDPLYSRARAIFLAAMSVELQTLLLGYVCLAFWAFLLVCRFALTIFLLVYSFALTIRVLKVVYAFLPNTK